MNLGIKNISSIGENNEDKQHSGPINAVTNQTENKL